MTVQNRLPGRPLNALNGPMLDAALRLVELQAGAGIAAEDRDFTSYVANVLFDDWDDDWADAPKASAAAGPLCARLRRWQQRLTLTQLDFGAWGHPLVFAALTQPAIDAADRALIDLPIVNPKRTPRRYCLKEANRLGGLQPGRLHRHKQCLDFLAGHVKRVSRVIQTAHLEPDIGAGRLPRHNGSMPATVHVNLEPGRPETVARPHRHKRHASNSRALRGI